MCNFVSNPEPSEMHSVEHDFSEAHFYSDIKQHRTRFDS